MSQPRALLQNPQGPRGRLRAWWLARLPATAEHVLHHRNLYVLPTRPGWMLGLTLLLLLVGSINYQLNLGYLLTFLLVGQAMVGVWVAHQNLHGLRLGIGIEGEAFAGQPVRTRIDIHNPVRRARWALSVRWGRPQADAASVDLPAGETASVALPLVFATRGRYTLPWLTIETCYPLGAFRVWSWWRPAGAVSVYPTPEADAPPLPGPAAAADACPAPPQAPSLTPAAVSDDLPDAVRPYRAGDSPARVLWKKAARRDGDPSDWLVRQPSHQQTAATLWLDSSTCGA
ncbi:MAG: DUF58 domain-containing protein, partial [Tepidimonas sp.]|uniref:DUF58 domain-containing protein n=1 Tax=Tepidimonas sp. TaxID=2002775 RepID=UPI00259EAA4B